MTHKEKCGCHHCLANELADIIMKRRVKPRDAMMALSGAIAIVIAESAKDDNPDDAVRLALLSACSVVAEWQLLTKVDAISKLPAVAAAYDWAKIGRKH